MQWQQQIAPTAVKVTLQTFCGICMPVSIHVFLPHTIHTRPNCNAHCRTAALLGIGNPYACAFCACNMVMMMNSWQTGLRQKLFSSFALNHTKHLYATSVCLHTVQQLYVCMYDICTLNYVHLPPWQSPVFLVCFCGRV